MDMTRQHITPSRR